MIPYFIQQANSSDDTRCNNIYTTYNCSEKDTINEHIIHYIINIMYEFCSDKYGHNIKITSYDDFCNKYWKIKGNIIDGWYSIFRIYYFENNWIEWNIEDHKEQIYISYINNYS